MFGTPIPPEKWIANNEPVELDSSVHLGVRSEPFSPRFQSQTLPGTAIYIGWVWGVKVDIYSIHGVLGNDSSGLGVKKSRRSGSAGDHAHALENHWGDSSFVNCSHISVVFNK